MVVERRGADGRWSEVKPEFACDYCDGIGRPANRVAATNSCYFCKGTGRATRYHERNYRLFSILADVRQYDDARLEVIIPSRRGLPDDLGAGKEADYYDDATSPTRDKDTGEILPGFYDLGEHSQTWLSLRELLDFDWGRTVTYKTVLDIVAYDEFVRNGERRPRGRTHELDGLRAGLEVLVSRSVMHGLINEGLLARTILAQENGSGDYVGADACAVAGFPLYCTEVSWTETYAQLVRDFHSAFIPALVTLGKPEDIRIVFGFDS